jgi:hypothetical protein
VLAVRASTTKRKRSSAVLSASLWRGASATEVGGNRERSTALRTCENVVTNSSVPGQAPHAPMCAVSRRSHGHSGASPVLPHVTACCAGPRFSSRRPPAPTTSIAAPFVDTIGRPYEHTIGAQKVLHRRDTDCFAHCVPPFIHKSSRAIFSQSPFGPSSPSEYTSVSPRLRPLRTRSLPESMGGVTPSCKQARESANKRPRFLHAPTLKQGLSHRVAYGKGPEAR